MLALLMLGALLFAMAMSLLAGQSAGATPTDNGSSQLLVPVLIKFHSNASAADIDDAIHGNGGIVTNDLKQIRTKVVHVPANARDRILAALAKHPAVERATAAIKLSRAGTPSDPAYSQQWALPKIAWDQAYGNVAISGHATIAVLDTGIDATHPDLTGRVVTGASFTGGDPNTDPNGHGTALAGIAAANVNDGIGMAGVAYAGTDVSSVQVLQADGTGYDSDVVAGVLWAADNGASVILMGFSSADYSFALADAIAYAWGRGAVLIAATGNDGSSGYTYPAGMPYVVGVAATDQDDVAASSSNTGSALIGAPGVGIYTTQPGGAYASFSGTSAAAAHAAGLAALLRASGSDNAATASKLRTGADATRINVANSFAADGTLPPPAGTPAGGVPDPTYTAAAKNLTVTFAGAASAGTVAVNDTTDPTKNTTLSGTSTVPVGNNDVGTLTASAASGFVFSGWSAQTGGITGCSGASCNFSMGNAAQSVTATFRKNVTASITASSKVYDGTTAATITCTVNGVNVGDVVTCSATSATFATASAGTGQTVTANGLSLGGSDAGKYILTNTTATALADITPKPLTVSFTAGNKTYDATTAATIATRTLTGVVSGDNVGVNGGTATFADKNVGTGKTVTATGFNLTGVDKSNYTVGTVNSTTANVTARAITVTAATNTKTYDRTTSAAATPTLTSGSLAGGDTANFTETYDNKNVGAGKTLTAAGSVNDGNGGNNYAITFATDTTGRINALGITASFTAANKVYDGTTAATVLTRSLGGVIAGDTVSLSGGTATFADKNVGIAKTATLSGASLTGTDAANYSLGSVSTSTANITARALTVSAHGVNKVYDGTTAATVTLGDDRVIGDVFTDTYTSATFSTKNVGTAKAVSVSGISISGSDAANYSANTTASTSADITARTLHVTAAGVNKIYDGTTAATVTLADDRVNGDVFTDTYTSATFNTKNVGTGKAVSVSGISISGTDAGNYSVNTTATTSADITARALHVSATGVNKVYDGTTTATITLADDRVSGDVFSTTYTSATFADKKVGSSKSVSVSGISISGSDAGNYTFNTAATTTADITARALTVSASGINKVYDGTTAATVTLGDDRVSGDVFADTYTSATFNNKNVGTAKTVSVSGISISGTDASNYAVNTTATTTADITARPLDISATSDAKTYDGTASSSAAPTTSGLQTGDSVTGLTQAFQSKNVLGTNGSTLQVVTGYTVNDGNAGHNYTVTTHTATGTISPKDVSGSFTAQSRIYDGTTAATVLTRSLSGTIGSDDVALSGGTASFPDKNVGTAKTVTLTGAALSGSDATNYNLTGVATTTADITARALTVSASGINKVYDGTPAATVTLGDDRVSGDVFADTYTSATFNNKIVGNAKAVSVSGIAISGADAANYTFNTAASTSADITARALTISAHGINKIYDGTATATVTLSDDRVSGDVFSTSYAAASFADKNVGIAKAVSVSGISISGADAANYTLNTTAATTADITARALSASAHGVNKVYDGTTAATVTLSDDRIAGDVLTASYTAATFADKNVGTAKAISVSGISISGTDASNYTFNTTATTNADITARTLHVTATGVNRVYDGTATASVTLGDDRVLGDVFTDTYASASFADKNVGTSKSVSVSGISITGTDAGNYALTSTTATTTADITARALHVSATGVNKIYDGTTAATVTLSDDRVSGDLFADTYTSATFNNKNVGTDKAVSVAAISISGTDAVNYALASTTASTTADITARPLTVSASGINKIYDGTTAATVTLSDDRVSGDVFSTSYTAASFADKNVGTAKTVSVSGIAIGGTDAANYSANPTASTTADITARALTVSAHGINKVYDGTTAATVTLSDDRVAGDVLSTSYTAASFADKNVGTSKSVSVTGISITGTDAGNYTFNGAATTTADITARALTVSAHGVNKVYDGTTAATVTLSDDRVAGDVLSTSYTAASFANKNVGTAKAVSVSGIAISGADAVNYALANTTAATTADITARALTVSASGINKVYDGTTAATVTLSDDRVSGDMFTDSYTSASFANKNVGTAKPISVNGIAISGTDAANYTVNATATASADITAKPATATFTANNKVYDGNASATFLSRTIAAKVAGDDLDFIASSLTFNNKNVGTGKTVTASGIALTGADASNYALSSTTATTSADITARALHISATGVNKVYDGTTTATVTLSDDRVSGDVFTDSSTSATFNNKNVGTGKAVSVSGVSIAGADAANYTFNTTASTAADITARPLTISAHGVSKVYDGTTAATVTLSDQRVSGDVFTDAYTSAAFNNKNVGTAKPISVSGIAIAGTDAGNYTFNTTASTSADITARTLHVGATGVNKIYDGTTAATVTLSDDRVAGDVFTDTYTGATFNNKNVGTAKAVSVSGIAISGADAPNYTFNTTASTTAAITARGLTVSAHGINKIYDGTTTATVTLTDDRVSGDVFTDGYTSATFNNKNVGTGKAVSVSGISIAGTDAGNYALANTTASTTADITARTVHVAATGMNKVYDGTTAAPVTLSDDRVAGDVFTDSYTAASFADKNVGTAKAVSVSGIVISGTDAANYTFNTSATTTANITARALTVSASGVNKVYDGTTAATVTLSDNRVSADVFTDAYTGALFADKNVGTGKTVSVSGISISGTDAANYTFNTAATTSADITPASLTITANNRSKYYGDAVVFAGTEFTSSGLKLGDSVTSVTLTSGGAAATATVAGSPYDIVPSAAVGVGLSNYTITYTNGKLTVYKASLTITANNRTKVFGEVVNFAGTEFAASGLKNSDAVTSVTLSSAGATSGAAVGNYSITPSAAAGSGLSNYTITYANGTLAVGQALAALSYTGPALVSTNSSGATLPLSAQVTSTTGTPSYVDWTKVRVKFLAWNSSGSAISVPSSCSGVVPSSAGVATCNVTLNLDSYAVRAQFDTGSFYTGTFDDGVTTIYQPQKSVTGGGWINDPWAGTCATGAAMCTPIPSANNRHGNFGFNVYYDKNNNLRGQTVFVFRGADGNTYQFKGNSWQAGWLTTPSATNASFQVGCNLQVMDSSGNVISSKGNLTCRVDMIDMGDPGSGDKYAFAVTDGNGIVVHQAGTPGNVPTPGTPSNPIQLGGGNVKIQLK